ncbi:MAG TPA: chloride channel protein [Candidatus Saccharimonadales bacterium]|nr:chloride channel protein [Candidatus Saccharimonadales bacterium]
MTRKQFGQLSSLSLNWAARPFGIFLDPGLGRRGRWIVYSALIGVVSGTGAILFDLAFRACQWLLLEKVGHFLPPASGIEGGPGYPPQIPWLLPLSLVIGGLISGALVFGLAPEAEGHGTDAVIKAFHHLRGMIRRRVPAVKAIASALTIGSGGSGGREGPIAQIGAGFGSFLADFLKLRNQDRRIMMMAGVAGGIGSIFRAPLGSAFFAAEVLYSEPEFEYLALLPGLISSITGYCIYCSYAGWGFLFNVPPISFHQPKQLPIYALLGLVCGMVGVIYPKVFYGTRDRIFHRLPIPTWTKPAVGALVLGVIGVYFPQCLGMGYGYLQHIIQGSYTIPFLLAFVMMKIVATSLTISSGGSGGVFGPSLVIGGSLGAAFGRAAAVYLPGIAPDPVACTMVAMGGFFAGVAKCPFAAIIMVMEMTGSYGLLVPSLLVGAITYLFIPVGVRLYENQVPSRSDSPAHLGSFAVDILRLTRLRDCWEPGRSATRTVPADASLTSIVELASGSAQNLFPVVDASGALLGEISIDDVRRALVAEGDHDALKARDLMRDPVGPLHPDDDLATAAKLLADRQTDAVTVVSSREAGIVLGTFSRRDLIVAYGKKRGPTPEDPEGEGLGFSAEAEAF